MPQDDFDVLGQIRRRNLFSPNYRPSDPEERFYDIEDLNLFNQDERFYPNFNRRYVGPLYDPEVDYYPKIDYQPETEATERFNKLLGEMPVREQPSVKRRLLAAIAAGLSESPELGEEILYGDYNRKVADWKTKLEPAYQAANLERYANANERALAVSELSAESRFLRDQQLNNIRTERLMLDKAKSDQIYEVKMLDMQRKIDDSLRDLQQKEAKLAADINNRENILAFNQAKEAARQAQFELTLLQNQRELAETRRAHDLSNAQAEARIKQLEAELAFRRLPTSTTVQLFDAEGKPVGRREQTTVRGESRFVNPVNSQGQLNKKGVTIRLIAPDGTRGTVTLEDYMANREAYKDYKVAQ